MSENAANNAGSFDMFKWLLVIVLLTAAVGGNYYFDQASVLIRAVGVVVAVIVALLIASKTGKGTQFVNFASEARIEVRKVVWPTRQETTQTTMIVMVATFVMALLLWGLDGIAVRVVSFITGVGI
ncbi:preprotein translocase subunit SecE [Paraneptunicella aestuarii]|uniref:preprotein translocase subunit SecE n=1 Tax=Paraneptunicella aestuarii TaxID=2831148 RepID=UPI001E32AD0F|nr:preprotein translocase subunit SecE [Paraneptunicella aestuarii]UAA38292.1 preprotein translocase subunit SecE [Paraneptunicella aestuarii]